MRPDREMAGWQPDDRPRWQRACVFGAFALLMAVLLAWLVVAS